MNEELDEIINEEEAAQGAEEARASETAPEVDPVPEAASIPEVDPITALEAEVQKFKDESLRRAAEMDNYRKRMAKELEEGRKFSNQRLLTELLPVLDNFGMGMQMAEKEQGSMLYQGMAMVQGQLVDFLTSQGVKTMEVNVGGNFDPNFHDAVSQECSDEVEPGKVLRVVRNGYMIGDRLLRPANLIVAQSSDSVEPKEEEGSTHG